MKSQQEIKKIADKWAAHSRGVCAMAGVEMTDLARISESIKGAIAEATAMEHPIDDPNNLNDSDTCCRCGEEYTVREGIDSSKYCDECAQVLVKLLESHATVPTWTKELPKEVHKCTPITEYATRTTPVKIKCIECGREL